MASTNQDNKSNNIDIQKMVEFVKKNARYFVAGALFVSAFTYFSEIHGKWNRKRRR